MNKVIILEGPDGAGKTHLAERLARKYNATVIHEGQPPSRESKLHYYANKLVWAHQQEKPIIFDRFQLGELVYPSIVGRPTDFGPNERVIFDRLMNGLGTRLYICMPYYKTMVEAWKERNREKKEFLDRESKWMASQAKFRALLAYYPRFNHEDRENSIITMRLFDNYFNGRPFVQTLPLGTIGVPFARYLIVGERANNRNLDLPFFYMKQCSGLLNKALWDAGFKEQDMAFANAYDNQGVERELTPIFESLPKLKLVLVFGKRAQDVLAKYPVKKVHLHHPQFIRRFQLNQLPAFVDNLKYVRENC